MGVGVRSMQTGLFGRGGQMVQDPKLPVNQKETSLTTHPDASIRIYLSICIYIYIYISFLLYCYSVYLYVIHLHLKICILVNIPRSIVFLPRLFIQRCSYTYANMCKIVYISRYTLRICTHMQVGASAST